MAVVRMVVRRRRDAPGAGRAVDAVIEEGASVLQPVVLDQLIESRFTQICFRSHEAECPAARQVPIVVRKEDRPHENGRGDRANGY